MAEFTVKHTVNCPYCAGEDVIKYGTRNGYQVFRCKTKGCEKRFNSTGTTHGRKVPPEYIGAAIRMYYSGMSYKAIAEQMRDAYDIPEPSKATVYEWVRDYTQAALETMKDYPAHTSGHWVVDEMVLDVGGDKYWNWNVMDHDTRYLLASYLSSERDRPSAEKVLRKAMAASANPPQTITTDKLPSYVPAIKTVFPEARHIQSEGLDSELNNNRSERVQGTFRDRTKTLRGLEGQASGQRYLDGWVLHYNAFREHEGLGHQTPAEAAKVNSPFTEWADVTRGAARPPEAEETREVAKTTKVSRWTRDNRAALEEYRREHTDLVWQAIPVAEVMQNQEKQKTRHSRPAPGLKQGSRYYVMRLKDGTLGWVRVSSQWGNLPATEGKGDRQGLPERNWMLEGGRRTRSGEPAKVSQAGFIPIAADGMLRPVAKPASPKAEGETTRTSPDYRVFSPKPDGDYQAVKVDPKTHVGSKAPEITVRADRGSGDAGFVQRSSPARHRAKRRSVNPTQVNIKYER